MSLKPTRRRNGTDMVTVRITHHLSREQVEAIVVERMWEPGDVPIPSKTAVEQEVRACLQSEGVESLDYVKEKFDDDWDDAIAWAHEVVDSLYPGWV